MLKLVEDHYPLPAPDKEAKAAGSTPNGTRSAAGSEPADKPPSKRRRGAAQAAADVKAGAAAADGDAVEQVGCPRSPARHGIHTGPAHLHQNDSRDGAARSFSVCAFARLHVLAASGPAFIFDNSASHWMLNVAVMQQGNRAGGSSPSHQTCP